MTLTLTIQGIDRLDNGEKASVVFDRFGGVIGRSPLSDWCLPDPNCYISSKHCDITYSQGVYTLTNHGANGTLLNNSPDPMIAPHRLQTGDVFAVGHYTIAVDIAGQAAPSLAAPQSLWPDSAPTAPSYPAASGPGGWPQPASPAMAPPSAPPGSGWPSEAATPAAPAADFGGWPQAAPPQPTPAAVVPLTPSAAPSAQGANPWGAIDTQSTTGGAWPPPVKPAGSSDGGGLYTPRNPDPQNVWGAFAASNDVDWARGGFGTPAPAPAPTPPATTVAQPVEAQPPVAPVHIIVQTQTQAPAAASDNGPLFAALVAGLGLAADDLKDPPKTVVAAAGNLLRRLVSGLVVMLEARARAKAQLGAQSTMFSFDGNNPLKFATTTEKALIQLLSEPARGFMPADKAVEDSFKDLQAHQVATLMAMQSALRATLTRFSPGSIRSRAEQRGFLARIIPAARDATLWHAYEREFSGVAEGSDEVFMDAFSKAFKEAYEQVSHSMK